MHRIDTPTAQIDKFGPGKNGFTNGDPATGRRATDLNSDMWDAVQEEVANAIEGNGIELDKSKHNQLYLAIQKAITDPGFLKKANNLSDVADKAEARGNLGLGTAATKDVGTDTGNVMPVGAFGLGVGPQHKAEAFSDLAKIYRINASSASTPGGSVYGVICLPCDGAPSAAYLAAGNNGELHVGRSTTASKGVLWNRVYTTAYKPTAVDVGAVASVNGTASQLKVTDELTIVNNAKLYRDRGMLYIESRDNNGSNPSYYSFSPGDGTFMAGRGYFDTDIRIGGEGIRIYNENNNLWFNVSGQYFGFQNDGVFKADRVFENNLRVYSPNNPQPPNLEWEKVGSYAFAMYGGSGSINFNKVVSGSNLYPSGAAGSAGGATLAGSWRCMGISTTVNDAYRSTLWMRVS
ncbi:hypothetical protein [Serratia sarumanii]|uniref:hypothetical protein n=1 Tax=Serratia sarumanii TaxID=3020826 RepID=UPI003F815D26